MRVLPVWTPWICLIIGVVAVYALVCYFYLKRTFSGLPAVSMLVILEGQEQRAEYFFHLLFKEARWRLRGRDFQCVAVAGGTDQTFAILQRLQKKYANLEVVEASPAVDPVLQGFPCCLGKVVQVCYLKGEMSLDEMRRIVEELFEKQGTGIAGQGTNAFTR